MPAMTKHLSSLSARAPLSTWQRWARPLALTGLCLLAGTAWAAKTPHKSSKAAPAAAAAATATAAAATSSPARANTCPPNSPPLSAELFQQAAQKATDRGFLWKVTRDDRSSYLYGTFHAGKAEWMAPGPLVSEALAQTYVTGLELNPFDPDLQRELASITQGVQRKLSPALQTRLQQRWQAECLPAAALGTAPPEVQALTLTFLSGRRDGLQPSFGTEIMLAVLARRGERPLVSLESAAGQMSALLAPNDADANTLVGRTLDELEQGQSRRMLARLAQLWEQGDLQTLERYADWCECLKTPLDRSQLKKLMDDRNPGLADRFEALHAEGLRVFGAVGSLHMVGPTGLPTLLEQRGFRVERLR